MKRPVNKRQLAKAQVTKIKVTKSSDNSLVDKPKWNDGNYNYA